MPRREIAVIDAGVDIQEEKFWDWIEQHRDKLVAISEDKGCGCCVHMWYLVLEDDCPPNPFPSTGEFSDSDVCFGAERDALLDEHL